MPRFRSLLPNLSSRAVLLEWVLRLLGLTVLCAVVYRYCYLDYPDPHKCRALLHKGRWLEIGDKSTYPTRFSNWQPPECMIHEYNKDEIGACLGKKRMVIVGDSTTRQVFWAIARKLDLKRAKMGMQDFLGATPKPYNIEFAVDELKLQFILDPYLNSSLLKTELEAFRKHHELGENPETEESAGLILLGAPGLWHARKSGPNHIRKFNETLDLVVPYMDHLPYAPSSFGDLNAPPAKDSARNLVLMAPVRTPWYPSLSPSRQETLTPSRIDSLNDLLQELSLHQGVDVAWSFAKMTYGQEPAYQDSGFHVTRDVANAEANVLLNLRCNAASAEQGVYPHDGTCCMNYRRADWRQKAIMRFTLISIFPLALARRKRFFGRWRFIPSAEFLRPFSVFALILCYCYFADRTQLFTKERQTFDRTEFLSACIITAVIGAVSIRKVAIPTRKGYSGQEVDTLLSRSQTEEWKGWMQALLLLIHHSNASKHLWAYEISQILGAGYFFMSGYGHTVYFLTTNDYSLRRVAHVLVRLNLFVCTLAYMMRTDYTFYHYAPLVSFWFLVIYCILRIDNSLNIYSTYVALKILFAAFIVTGFVLIPKVLESLFIILKFVLHVKWDAPQLRRLISQDLYIVYLGMIFATFSHRISSLISKSASTPSRVDPLLNYLHKNSSIFRPFIGLLAMIILPVYWIVTVEPHTKIADYDKFHPYLSFIPILCFLTLRDCTTLFRSYHSTFFIWLGRHSLELYLLQYHIWLAGDSRGILRLGLEIGRRTEFVSITALFLWVVATLKHMTSVLVDWIISGRMGVATRRAERGDENESRGRRRLDESYELGRTTAQLHLDTDTVVLPDHAMIPDGDGTPSKDHGFNTLGRWGDLAVRMGVLVLVALVLNISYR